MFVEHLKLFDRKEMSAAVNKVLCARTSWVAIGSPLEIAAPMNTCCKHWLLAGCRTWQGVVLTVLWVN
jgi:hypothetical protein